MGFAWLGLVLGAVADLGDAVREVVDDVQPADVLLLQQIDRVRILLAEDRDQHVGAGDFLLAGGLHVVDGALQHALEAERGLGVAAVVGRQHRHGVVDDLAQAVGQLGLVGAAGLEHGIGRGVVEQGQQQVLDGHELMARLARLLVALADASIRDPC